MDYVYALHGTMQSLFVPYIAYKKPQGWMVKAIHSHFILFKFIPAKNNEFFRMKISQYDFNEFFPKRSCAAGYQNI